MQLATDPDDAWVVILEVGTDECHVRELGTGETRWIARSEVTPVEPASLPVIGDAIEESRRPADSAIRTDRAWGLVLVVAATSPVTVRALLDATSECESDLNGLLADLEAGGVLDRTDAADERAYRLTERGLQAVDAVSPTSE